MMVGGDELIASGSYMGFSIDERYSLEDASDLDVSSVLVHINSIVEPFAYRFSGIDYDSIDSFAKPSKKGLEGVISFLKLKPLKEIRNVLLEASPKRELLPAAESCFFNRLLINAGLSIVPEEYKLLPSKEEKVEGQIIFIARFRKWMAIKKLSLHDVEDWEVSALLCGINHTLVNKSFDFKEVSLDPKVAELTSARKSMKNAVSALESIFDNMPEGEELSFLLNNVLTGIGYPPYATLSMLEKAYDVKPPKPKGRHPKS